MSSISAHNAIREHAVYAGSKCAVEAFARCFSQEFGARRITVNSIAPGGVKTDMAADVGYKYLPMADSSWSWEQIEGIVAKRTPLGRIADPIDIARVVSFLASDDAAWVNGQNITISGGAAG
jgi:NAD(P)-dependent dehydrogenase (short-subunit alcohol dehydrogenase family)